MDEVKNSSKEQNKSAEQRNSFINKASLNLIEKNKTLNNNIKKENNDYKSFLQKHNRSLY